MTRIFQLLLLTGIAVLTFNACKKPDAILRNEANSLARIWATIPGEKDYVLDPVLSANGDTAYFDVPFYYPEASNKEVDITKMILRADVPSDAIVTPALGVPIDLTNPFTVTITSGQGQTKTYVAVGRKVSDKSLRNVTLTYGDQEPFQESNGVLRDNNEILFYIIPGTDLTHAKLTFDVNVHASSDVATGAVIDLTNPLPVTVTGNDGVTKTYTLKRADPEILPYGIGLNRKLWEKSAADLGFTEYSETGIAVSGDYLVVVSSGWPSRYRIYNRSNGNFIQEKPLPSGVDNNASQLVSDSAGHLLAASYTDAGGSFYLYKYNDAMDNNPAKLVQWTTPSTAGGGIGRRVNLYGDLSGNAVIMVTESLSGNIYKWNIVNGAVESNTPQTLVYAGDPWTYQAEAQPLDATGNPDYILNHGGEFALVNGATNQKTASFAPGAIGTVWHAPTEFFKFNNASYVMALDFGEWWALSDGAIALLDITDRARIPLPPDNANFSKLRVFASDFITRGTYNANGTGDLCVKVGPDKVEVYMLLTNAGILAYEITRYAP
jgi:hypothetical protein